MTTKDYETLQLLYRKVFGTPEGQIVIAHMLTELHFFDEIIEDPEEIALSNYARRLLMHCRIWNELNVSDLVDKFFGIAPRFPEETDGTG
jgi:hypothetical protein